MSVCLHLFETLKKKLCMIEQINEMNERSFNVEIYVYLGLKSEICKFVYKQRYWCLNFSVWLFEF